MPDKNFTEISRDPYARVDFVRRLVDKDDRKDCDWCGSAPGRFEYGYWEDGINKKPVWLKGAYCCVGCGRNALGF